MKIRWGAWLFSVLCLMYLSPSGCSCRLYPPGGAGLSSGAGFSAGLWGGDVLVWPATPRPAERSRCGGWSTRTCRAQVRTNVIPQVNKPHSTQHLRTDIILCKAAMFVWLDSIREFYCPCGAIWFVTVVNTTSTHHPDTQLFRLQVGFTEALRNRYQIYQNYHCVKETSLNLTQTWRTNL